MIQAAQYYGRFNSVRGDLFGLPRWARVIVAIAAIPGFTLLLLSMLAFAVSLLALLLLTVPLYVVLKRLLGARSASVAQQDETEPSAGVKRVEATVVE